MHVVLVNPGSPLRRTGGLLARFVEPIPPLGLTGLAAFLRPHGHTVTVLDQYATAEDADTLTARIVAEQPGLVGFSCLTPNMGEVLDVVSRLRVRMPDVPIVFGNTHAAVFHDRILARKEADYCVRGEGEEPLLALVDALEGRRSLSSVPNLGYRDADGTVVRTPDAKPQVSLDDLPFPDWSRIDLGAYVNHPMIAMHGPTLPIQGSRGCAYACTFCAQDQIFKSVRRRSHASVCDEIEHDMATYGVNQFGFIDAYWPLSVKHGHAFLDELERRGLHRRITWVTETRVDKVDQGLLQRMAADGCRLIMYGVEFGDDEMLVATQKRTESSQTRDAIRWTHEAGILTLGLYIIGMPGQDTSGIERTFAFARELGTDIAKFNIAVPLPGSKFFEEVFGDRVDDLPYEAFSSWYDPTASGRSLAWTPDGLDGTELVRLQRYGMLRYYLRPSFVLQTLRRRSVRPVDMVRGAGALLGDAARIAYKVRRTASA